MMKKLFVAAAFSLVAASAHAVSFFDDFETNTANANSTPNGWSVSGGTVDIVGPGYYPDLCYYLGRCIDMDGSTGNAGRLTSAASFTLVSGGTYTLSFDYTWNYFNQQFPNSMTYGVGTFSTVLNTSGNRGTSFIPLSFQFTGDGSVGSIFFDHAGGDNGGIIIDNVRLVGPDATGNNGNNGGGTPAVPLPAGLPLLLSGFGIAALIRRRR